MSIAIYDDRLEIRSTGSLPGGLTPEDLRKPHPSVPRNPSIAGVLYNRGIIEQWGRGTSRMMDLAKQAGLPHPEFEDRGGQFTVRFRPSVYQPPKLVQHSLTGVQEEILLQLNDHGPASLKELSERLGRPKRTVQDNLKRLQDMKLADMKGRGRATQWYRK
ncbi:MAG TPA: ATP-binding protein [Longimicrobiales bacterium]|nr:ATP-binding protein [Longimicrobiales bacterium]